MKFDRLKRITTLNRRSSIAATTASAAVLLIVGGIAFASNGSSGTQTINQAASLFHSASPSDSDSTSSSGTNSTGGTSAPVNGDTGNKNNSLPTPTTIIGPHGEKIVVPPLTAKTNATVKGQAPSTGTTVPANGSVSTPTVTTPITTGSTTPASVTTTTMPRAASTNGPAAPTASISATDSPEDPTVALAVSAADTDGYITSIAVDWGDSSSQSVINYSLSACTDPESSSHGETPSHDYTDAGSYNITVTVTSMNCTGDTTQAQQAIRAASVVTGGTATPPVTTVSSGSSDPSS